MKNILPIALATEVDESVTTSLIRTPKSLSSESIPLVPCLENVTQLDVYPHFQNAKSDYVLSPSWNMYKILHFCQVNCIFRHLTELYQLN